MPVTTIDKIVAEIGIRRVDFIKMDIKGSTAKALVGAREVLKTQMPRLAISTEEDLDRPGPLAALVSSLQPAYRKDCGYCAIEDGKIVPMVLFSILSRL